MTIKKDADVLEQNVSTLLETGGEAPKLPEDARTRMRAQLIAKHGIEAPSKTAKSPLAGMRAIGFGLVAAAAAALIVTRVVGGDDAGTVTTTAGISTLADGSTWIAEGTSKVTVLGERRVRVEGAALLDIAPAKTGETFVVETAQGTIHVLGTRFLVDATALRTTAAVVRGQVKLATASGDVLLHAGEQAVAEPGRPPTRGPAPRLSHLVSWAAQARRRAESDLRPLRNGSLFARDPGMRNGQFGAEYPLPLHKLGIDIVVENQVARVALDQTFYNSQDRVLEGVYKFAIPSDAALQRLAMYVDGKLTESAVVERMRARRIYEELVYRRVDPALLEWEGTGKLSLRVYPLPARQEKRLVLAYTQSLAKLYGDWSLTVPLPEIDAPVGEVAFDVTVRGCANCEITSTSHPITVARKGEDATVTYRKSSVTIGDSLVLHVRDARQKTTVATQTVDGERFLLVRAPAELPRATKAYRPKTWVILDDVSASRGAIERIAQADLVDAFVRELDEDDKLAVITFDVAARTKLAPTRVMDIDRRALRAALKAEGDVGATDFSTALAAATKLLAGTSADDAMIVYLGDGVVTSGTRRLDALRSQLVGKARFIGVGVGDGSDTQTLEALAAATGGYATTIDLADDLGWRAFDLVAALHTTRVTGVQARLVDANGQLVPATVYVRSPQLADGEEIEVVAKLAGDGVPATLELTGGDNWTQRISLAAASADATYVPRLWAHRHIAARMLAKHEAVVVPPCEVVTVLRGVAPPSCKTEQQVRDERDEAIRKEVVELGKQYFLLSRHTSLLVLENDAMYAKYGVRKGAGDTWAPYALPATIPVVTGTATPSDLAADAELVRSPLQVFYAYDGPISGSFDGDDGLAGFGMFQTQVRARQGVPASIRTREELSLVPAQIDTGAFSDELEASGFEEKAKRDRVSQDESEPSDAKAASAKGGKWGELELRGSITSIELQTGLDQTVARKQRVSAGPMVAQRFTYPADQAFDDLSALAAGLFPDASDAWRQQLAGAAAAPVHPIDEAAKSLLAQARAALPVGVYRWDGLEIGIDADRRMGWRRTTDSDLAETASFDGTTLTRRYAELGLDVTRPISSDDVALGLAYLPLWIAEPAHYARWFEVKAKGARTVTLSSYASGAAKVVLQLEFDANHHLVAIRDGAGKEQLAVTWGPAGPVSARAQGRDVAVGFTGQAIANAATWAHAAAARSVNVELPLRMPAYWAKAGATETVGSAAWRRVQRQYLASLAATSDRATAFGVYEALRQNGGVEVGDLVLASGGIATSSTDKEFAAALAPHATAPLARYLIAGRAYGKSPTPERMKPETTTGALGALWQLREISALLAASKGTLATDRLVAMGTRALQVRLIAAAMIGARYDLKTADVGRAWSSVATGRFVNVARANASQALYNRGLHDAATDMLATMVEKLDLTADPPFVANASYMVQASRRGSAGWQLLWSTWRDRVLASSSYEHVIALVQVAQSQPADLPAVFDRAVELAGDDFDRKVAVAELALQRGLAPYAYALAEDLVKKHPTRQLHLLAAQFAQQQQRTEDALAHYEAAQQVAADEAVSIATVRSELTTIITTAKQLALETRGAKRATAVAKAMSWGAKWRAIDPGNASIDRLLGELQLAIGNRDEAWRQLSGAIERDPMSGAGYMTVAEVLEQQGRVADALELWQQAIVIEQTNPVPRFRKAQALFALGRTAEGDALLEQVANGTWHEMWGSQVFQAKQLLERAKQSK